MKNLIMTNNVDSIILHSQNDDLYIRYDKNNFDIEIYDMKNDVYWEEVDQDIQDIFIKIISDNIVNL